ncbi:MAG: 4Fe-4S dicluster domain-containing protein [Desulfobacterales bacterium]|nr:4Fe-4S dicluster domain-containing protein [Desulfobacterales bacterium]
MIKRPFTGLSQPKLKYDSVESDPKGPETVLMPSNILLLLNDSLDSLRTSLIKKEDQVKKGEKLSLYTESTEYVISPVSGVIKKIESYPGEFGNIKTYLVIGTEENDDFVNDFEEHADKFELEAAAKLLKSLPGAPPFETLIDPTKKIHTLVISGVDEDLASTTRQYFLSTAPEDLKEGIKILQNLTKIPKIILTVPEGFNVEFEISGMQVFNISSFYPNALPEMIMKNQLKTTVPQGKTCEDIGVCFISSEAVVSIAKACRDKKVHFEKLVCVTGKDGVQKRIKTSIGTPVKSIFKHLNIHTNKNDRIVIGGPFKGFSVFTIYHPVQPCMDSIIVQDAGIIPFVSDSACINCGKCIKICPANIPVNLLVRQLEANLFEEAKETFDLESCIECGLCSYVCTAKIPIFQYIRLGKHELLKMKTETEKEGANG